MKLVVAEHVDPQVVEVTSQTRLINIKHLKTVMFDKVKYYALSLEITIATIFYRELVHGIGRQRQEAR